MFWLGLYVGLFVGCFFGFILGALLSRAKYSDMEFEVQILRDLNEKLKTKYE